MLVLSHAQSDHAGGAERLLDHLRNIEEVWLADVPANHGYRAMNEVVGRITEQGGTVRWLKKGDVLAFGDAEVDILWPPKGFDPANDNHTSLVLSMRLSTGETLLFPADIENAGEAKMIEAGLGHHDIMLIPHHGSRTSSSDMWVKYVSPDVAIVQTGWKNRYGFPYTDVMQRYWEQGTQLLDTKHGAVTIRFNKHMDKSLISRIIRASKLNNIRPDSKENAKLHCSGGNGLYNPGIFPAGVIGVRVYCSGRHGDVFPAGLFYSGTDNRF